MKKITAVMTTLLALLLTLAFTVSAGAASTEEWLELSVTTQEEADVLYEQYADSFNGGNIRLKINGDSAVFMPFLQRFSFDSLALYTQSFGSGVSIGDICGIKELACPYDIVYKDISEIKKLTIYAEDDDYATLSLSKVFDYAPNLESLTLHFSSGWSDTRFSLGRGMVIPTNLQTVEVTVDDAPEILPVEPMTYFIASLKSACPKATLNGAPVAEWKTAQEPNDATCNAIEQISNDAALCSLYKRYAEGESDFSGTPSFGQKLVVMIYHGSGELETSLESANIGMDYYGLPASRMASTLEEADTAIILFSKWERVGTYTNGLPANSVDTMVGVVDLINGKTYAPYSAMHSSPPQSITMMGGGHGDFMPETALAAIAEMLR